MILLSHLHVRTCSVVISLGLIISVYFHLLIVQMQYMYQQVLTLLYHACILFYRALMISYHSMLLSSPEPKAQVSFSDNNLSVVSCCCCFRRRRNLYLHFHLLLQNHWASFNQTWHNSSFGEGDSNLFK